eukprot:234791_1
MNTNTFLENELMALNRLLEDQMVSESIVNMVESSLMSSGIMTAILCEPGAIYFYDSGQEEAELELKFVLHLSSVIGIQSNDQENTFQFVLQNKHSIKIQFRQYNVYQKWKSVYLSSLIQNSV